MSLALIGSRSILNKDHKSGSPLISWLDGGFHNPSCDFPGGKHLMPTISSHIMYLETFLHGSTFPQHNEYM